MEVAENATANSATRAEAHGGHRRVASHCGAVRGDRGHSGTVSRLGRQLASRARRRVRGAKPAADADLSRQREVVEAFLAASRGGDFDRLVAVLEPEVEFRVGVGMTVVGCRIVTSK
jgi:hypothetical protein